MIDKLNYNSIPDEHLEKKGKYFLGKILDELLRSPTICFDLLITRWVIKKVVVLWINCMCSASVFLFSVSAKYRWMPCYSLAGMHWNYVILLFLCCMLFFEVIQPLMIQKKDSWLASSVNEIMGTFLMFQEMIKINDALFLLFSLLLFHGLV